MAFQCSSTFQTACNGALFPQLFSGHSGSHCVAHGSDAFAARSPLRFRAANLNQDPTSHRRIASEAGFSWRQSEQFGSPTALPSVSVRHRREQNSSQLPCGTCCKVNTSGTAEPDNGGKDSGTGERVGAPQWAKASEQPVTDASSNDGEREEEDSAYRVPAWDLAARRKRLQEAASKMGDPFRGMVTRASRTLQDYFDKHKGAKVGMGLEKFDSIEDTEWENWQKVFADVEEKYALLEGLQFQLDEAIDQEDYREAARLKAAFDGCAVGDPMATSLAELERCLKDERYEAATRIRDQTGIDLIGWWGGVGEDEDPYGRIINISPMQGRLIARSYTAKHLAAAREGRPLFEIFIARDEDGSYANQPVYLRRSEGMVRTNGSDAERDVQSGVAGIGEGKGEEGKSSVENKGKGSGSGEGEEDDNSADGLAKIMSFLKDKMPGIKGQVIHVINPADMNGDTQSMVEQVLKKIAEAAGDVGEDSVLGKSEGKAGEAGNDLAGPSQRGSMGSLESSSRENGKVQDGGSSEGPEGKELDVKVSFHVETADALETSGSFRGSRIPRPPERVPATIERKGRDEFAFCIEGPKELDALSALKETGEGGWKMSATVVVHGEGGTLAGELPAKKSWSMDNLPMKPEQFERLVKLAVQQARRGGLPKSTNFRRINVDNANADPLSGLYIGAFGPYTSEVVQLRRKFGHWVGDESSVPYEYVEAVKLTGDLNVPAGEVTFRAKIGRHQRLSYQGIYPEELGVTARYKGQGRLAEVGFKNPRWIDGELVLLDGKLVVGGSRQAGGPANGAELGFVYSVPERHFLVLFNRLKLRNN